MKKKVEVEEVKDTPSLLEKVQAHLTFARMGLGGNLAQEDWKAVLELAKKQLQTGTSAPIPKS